MTPAKPIDFTADGALAALLVSDPQDDFLSPDGATWGIVGASVTANGTVEHIDQLFAAAIRASAIN